MKVIIAGSRNFKDYELLKKKMDFFNSNGKITEVVSGAARGADTLGEKWAEERDIPIKSCPANWAKLGRSAGYIRNKEMAEYADALVAFWDGVSRGTNHTIDIMTEMGKPIRIVNF